MRGVVSDGAGEKEVPICDLGGGAGALKVFGAGVQALLNLRSYSRLIVTPTKSSSGGKWTLEFCDPRSAEEVKAKNNGMASAVFRVPSGGGELSYDFSGKGEINLRSSPDLNKGHAQEGREVASHYSKFHGRASLQGGGLLVIQHPGGGWGPMEKWEVRFSGR